MTRSLTTPSICFVLLFACASARAEDIVIHERSSKECQGAETAEWKLQGEQPLGVVLKELSRVFCATFFVERELMQEKINLHFRPTNDHHELHERLSGALRAEGIDLDIYIGYDVRRRAPPAVILHKEPQAPWESSSKYIHCKANQCEVKRELRDKLFADTASLFAQARFVPSTRDGKPNGFKIYAVRPNSLFSLLGLQNGDGIITVNGSDMSTPDAALALFTKLREATHFAVTVERRGAPQFTVDITIKD